MSLPCNFRLALWESGSLGGCWLAALLRGPQLEIELK
jgi:hypothetical protein